MLTKMSKSVCILIDDDCMVLLFLFTLLLLEIYLDVTLLIDMHCYVVLLWIFLMILVWYMSSYAYLILYILIGEVNINAFDSILSKFILFLTIEL